MNTSRIEKFRKVLEEKNIDAILIKSKTNKKYLNALTGSGVQVLLTKDSMYQIMDGRYVNEARLTTSGFELKVHDQGVFYMDIVKDLMKGKKHLGMEANQMLVKEYLQVEKYDMDIVLLDHELEEARRCKDEQEILLVKKACELTDEIFAKVIDQIRIGMKEYEVSALLQYYALQAGASAMAFDTIVASGTRGAMPHGRPTDKVLQANECITIDFGITYQGYQSDMTRTICIGQPTQQMQEIYDLVLQAQCAGVDFIKAGRKGKEVDAYVRGIIEQAGYGEYFTHGLGHGLGLGGGEFPLLNQRSETILEEGMIMSCEPGIYIPEVGGVRIEDDVLIQQGRGVPLNKTTKQLIILEDR